MAKTTLSEGTCAASHSLIGCLSMLTSVSPALAALHSFHSTRLGQVQAEKNLAWEAAQQQSNAMAQMNAMAGMGAGTGPCKLAVNNLHPNITVSCLLQACLHGPCHMQTLQC